MGLVQDRVQPFRPSRSQLAGEGVWDEDGDDDVLFSSPPGPQDLFAAGKMSSGVLAVDKDGDGSVDEKVLFTWEAPTTASVSAGAGSGGGGAGAVGGYGTSGRGEGSYIDSVEAHMDAQRGADSYYVPSPDQSLKLQGTGYIRRNSRAGR